MPQGSVLIGLPTPGSFFKPSHPNGTVAVIKKAFFLFKSEDNRSRQRGLWGFKPSSLELRPRRDSITFTLPCQTIYQKTG